MFDFITGKIITKHPTNIVIENNGIGWSVQIPLSTFNVVGKAGDAVKLMTSFHIRPEAWTIYGFATEEERALFNLLISVSGIGPKSAIAALSGMSAQQIQSAIVTGDADKLTVIPGIGKKTAQRIVLELKDKVKVLGALEVIPLEAEFEEAVLALEALGFNRNQAEKAVEKARKTVESNDTSDIIRKALYSLTLNQ
jgi:Holliday junction DNA helicase RuvA